MANLQTTKQAVANTEVRTVYDFIEMKKDLIAKALPKTITPERLIGVFTMLLKSSPALTQCTQNSLIAAVIQTVQLGLTPGNINHCYYVPFNNKQKNGTFQKEVQFILSYRGMVELVNRSGKACILNAECVYSKDEFQYEQGLNPILRHIPATGERGEFIAVYCIAKNMLANEKVFVVLDKKAVDKVKASSKAGASSYSPWVTWFDEMAKKTAVKRIFKLLPMSVDIQESVSADETIKSGIDRDMVSLPDSTNWEKPEEIEEADISSETPEEKPSTLPDTARTETEVGMTLSGIAVGGMCSEFEGLVMGFSVKDIPTTKAKAITTYHVADAGGVEFDIQKWGGPKDDCENAICLFTDISVSDFRGVKQYTAKSMEVKS